MDKIDKPSLLLVEGPDEKAVCELLLKQIQPDYSNHLDLQHGQGGSGVLALAKALPLVAGFEQLTRMAVLVDAEETPQETQQQWAAFKLAFEKKHSKKTCEFLILPSPQSKGALDSVFMASLEGTKNPVALCAQNFVECVGTHGALTTQARKDKVALISYINAHSKNPYSRLGVALKQGPEDLFDFNHASFQQLTNFLRGLF